ncbi:MAG: DUF4169 family protein [Paracoccaceae bacterium]
MNDRIVNLRRARKQKARTDKQDAAAQRIREAGAGGNERRAEQRNENVRVSKLDMHRLGRNLDKDDN